jgi:ATP-dependent Lhr-like helicase
MHPRDILDAAVMASCIVKGSVEASTPVLQPLDVLAQIIVSMTGIELWSIDELYSVLRASYPYHNLTRRQFDLVLAMLAGRYDGSRIRELFPRLLIDRVLNTVKGRDGCLRLLYHSGGTIPDRGCYDLRVHGSGAKIGELDEEFVWERKPDDTFIIGAQRWRIVSIDSQKVEVVPWQGKVNSLVFWKEEKPSRGFFFCSQIGEFLERWDGKVGSQKFGETLTDRFFLDETAVKNLVDFLERQRQHTGVGLPHRHHLLVEHCRNPEGRAIIHTLWGGRVNRPFGIALQAAWERRNGFALELFSDDDCVMILTQDRLDIREILNSVRSDVVEQLLRAKLEHTGFFSSRFRENAAISLLLPRSTFGERTPLWLRRIRAKQLMDAVMDYDDFPILAETWRSCLRDEFDIETLKELLDELHDGSIRVSEVRTNSPSPFARGIVFRQTEKHVYDR